MTAFFILKGGWVGPLGHVASKRGIGSRPVDAIFSDGKLDDENYIVDRSFRVIDLLDDSVASSWFYFSAGNNSASVSDPQPLDLTSNAERSFDEILSERDSVAGFEFPRSEFYVIIYKYIYIFVYIWKKTNQILN